MVYGNAIANYRTNASSYSSATSSSETYLNCFKNARGENISSPWIRSDLGIGNNSRLASVIWSDTEGLIDTEVVTSNDYVIFHIDRDKIKPGNAVVALWDGDGKTNDANIVWSWHIWVTDESLGYSDCIPVTNQNNNNWFLTVEQTVSDNNGSVLLADTASRRTSPLAGNILAAMEVIGVQKTELLRQMPWLRNEAE